MGFGKLVLLFAFLTIVIPFLTQDADAVETVTWDGGGDGINWSDPRNWSTDALPSDADHIAIDDNALVNSAVNLDIDFTLTGTLTIDHGDILIILNNARFNNEGTIDISGALSIEKTFLDNSASIGIRIPGFFNVDGEVNNGATGTINNDGTTTIGSGGSIINSGIVTNAGKFKIAENESPRPQDRVFFNFNFFENLGEFTINRGAAFSNNREFINNGIFNIDLGGKVINSGTTTNNEKVNNSGEFIADSTLQPFVGFILNTDTWFNHGFSSITLIDGDFTNEETALLSNDVGVGYFLFRESTFTNFGTIAPSVEVQIKLSENGNKFLDKGDTFECIRCLVTIDGDENKIELGGTVSKSEFKLQGNRNTVTGDSFTKSIIEIFGVNNSIRFNKLNSFSSITDGTSNTILIGEVFRGTMENKGTGNTFHIQSANNIQSSSEGGMHRFIWDFARDLNARWIDPDGTSVEAVCVFCDMTVDGGGWILIATGNEINVNSQGDENTFQYRSVEKLNHQSAGDSNSIQANNCDKCRFEHEGNFYMFQAQQVGKTKIKFIGNDGVISIESGNNVDVISEGNNCTVELSGIRFNVLVIGNFNSIKMLTQNSALSVQGNGNTITVTRDTRLDIVGEGNTISFTGLE